MILETIRMVADALATGSYGVNTQLASIPVGSDSTPPSILLIADETRNDEVAVGRYPEEYPCLVVTLDGNVELMGEVISDYRDAKQVTVMVRYVQSNIDTAQARTDTYYTLRAVQKCLRTFFSNLHAEDRSLNDIQVIECLSMTHVPMFENINDTMVTSGIRITMFVRDTTP